MCHRRLFPAFVNRARRAVQPCLLALSVLAVLSSSRAESLPALAPPDPVKPDPIQPLSPAVLKIRQPVTGEVFAPPATVRIELEAVDPNGDIRHVEFLANGQTIGRSDHWTKEAVIPGRLREHTLEWHVAQSGRFQIVARAPDTLGQMVESEPVLIVVGQVLPVVSIHTSIPETTEPAPNIRVMPAAFQLRRTGDTKTPLTVFLRYEGSASPGADYERLPETVTFGEGTASMELLVQPMEDADLEGLETVVATLFDPPLDRAPDHVIDAGSSTAKVVIHDAPGAARAWVEITSPSDGDALKSGQSITLAATAVDPESYIARVEFFDFDRLLGVSRIDFIRAPDPGTPVHHTFEWQQPGVGEHALTARALDAKGNEVVSRPVHVKVVSAAGLPVVQVATDDAEGIEFSPFVDAFDPVRFRVSREGDLSQDLEVFFTLHGTAEAGQDYRSPGRSVRIPAGERDATVEIVPISDDAAEGMETVALRLEDPRPISSVPTPPVLYDLAPFLTQAGAVIYERQPPEGGALELALPSDGGVYQQDTPVRFIAAAFHPGVDLHQVDFYSGDQRIGSSEITFARIQPGGLIIHHFDWVNPVPGEHVVTAHASLPDGRRLVSSQVRLKVWESAPAVVVLEIIPTDELAAEAGPGGSPDPAVFTVRRVAGPKDVDVTVYYDLDGAARNGVDYQRLSGELLLRAGQDSVDLIIDPIPDRGLEGDESVAVLLRPPICPAIFPPPPWCYRVGPAGAAKAVILDYGLSLSDPAPVRILSPRNGSAFPLHESIDVAVAVSETISIAKLELLIDGQVVDSTSSPSLGFKWVDAPPGPHLVEARLWDTGGAESRSEPVKILVYEGDLLANGKVNPPEGAIRANINRIECRKDGDILLQLVGPNESLNLLEVSSDLIHWAPVAPLFLPGGEVLFNDKAHPGEKQRFYRVR